MTDEEAEEAAQDRVWAAVERARAAREAKQALRQELALRRFYGLQQRHQRKLDR